MEIRGILFDMDGTLIDSEEVTARSAMAALAEYGVYPEPSDFEPFVGRGDDLYLGGVSRKYGVEYQLRMKQRMYFHYGEMVKQGATVQPDTYPTLLALRSRGIKMAVCSSADREKVLHNVHAIGVDETFFDALITGSDVDRKKPAPDIYLKGAEVLGLKPEQCLVVEDAPSGIDSGHAARMPVAGILSSFGADVLSPCKPDYLIYTLSELLNILEGM